MSASAFPAPATYPILDLKKAQPLLLTYVNASATTAATAATATTATTATTASPATLPRMTSFLRGNPLDPSHKFNEFYALRKMELYLSNPLPRNAMVNVLNQSRKRRISHESMMAINTMNLLHCGINPNPNNIGPSTDNNAARKRPALGGIADAPAAMH